MATDLTLLYYTASVIDEDWARRVREELVSVSGDRPIVSVSRKPLAFGFNITVGCLPVSPYTLYRQILEGAQVIDTKWVACCEDDTIYAPQHFEFEPERDDTFYYNRERWWLEPSGTFRYRDRASMCACIVARDLLVAVLKKRFEKFPDPLPGREAWRLFGEPGRMEDRLGLPEVRLERFSQVPGVVTFNHRDSLGGKRKVDREDPMCDDLPYWGNAAELWERLVCG